MRFLCDRIGAPDIPERLLQAHEDGKVVFFCGAGISYPAKLPGFEGLVKQLYQNIGMHNYETREQQLAIKSMQFDLAIHLLEKSLENGHERVRGEIAKILGYPKTKGVAISFHKSLLALAKNKDNQYRLITTNFDRIFEKIRKRKEYQANAYIAPNLPLVDDKWNGIVYLHGLINESLEGAGQDTLIVSSGDFGLAYLIDRWASRFMEKVFLNYSVCFIGYKLGDPLIRYMTDAITAIRSKKGTIPEVFAFCPYSGSKIDSTQQTWESKGLTPIMYNQKFKHYLLRETLKAWSASYRLGLQGRASIVQSLSRMKLRSNTISNDKICQMIWALCDPTGHASRRFAETTPTFDLGWLTAFAEKEYDSDSLELFGISHNNRKSEHKVHTLLSRPPSDIHQLPVLSLVNNTMHNEIELDVSMTNISTWLTYHLNNPTLLLWIQKQGGVLHPTFRRKISNRLREIVILERNNNIENKRKLNELKAKGSDTIPNSQMRMLWELMISGRFHLPHIEPGFLIALYQNNEENELMLTSSDIILRVLTPAIRIREIFPFTNQIHDYSNSEEERKKLETIVVLNAQTNLILNATERSERFKESLAEIALELTLKLKEASELYEIASKLNELPFRSMLSIPNLDDIQVYHSDKYAFRSLTRLVLDSWKTLHAKDPELAFSVLNLWQSLRFPIFKRLFFYGLAVVDQFNVSLLINVFRQDEGQWLWSEETQFEVLQILKKVAKYCRTAEVKQITDLLLSSIPYRKHEDCNSLLSPSDIPAQEYALWMRLAVMNSINSNSLDSRAKIQFSRLIHTYSLPERLEKNNEFPVRTSQPITKFMTGTQFPRDVEKIIQRIMNSQNQFDPYDLMAWRDLYSSEPKLVVESLLRIGGVSPKGYFWWDTALSGLANPTKNSKFEMDKPLAWDKLSKAILNYPDQFYKNCTSGLGWWINANSSIATPDDPTFLNIVKKIIRNIPYKKLVDQNYITQSLNSSLGNTTSALISYLFQISSKEDDLIPDNIKDIFVMILEIPNGIVDGITVLGTTIDALHTIDPVWTKSYVLPLMKWNNLDNKRTSAIWQGFLWNPIINIPLLIKLKSALLQTSKHMNKLGSERDSYVRVITDIGIHETDIVSFEDVANVIEYFTTDDLGTITQYLGEIVKSLDNRLEEFWKKKITPFLHHCWPKSKDKTDESIAQDFVLMCINGKNCFKVIYDTIRHYLVEVTYPEYVIMELKKNQSLP